MTSDLLDSLYASCLFPILTAIRLVPWIIENHPFIGFRAKDALCLSAPLLYLSTVVMAVFIARRREFHKYDLIGITDATTAFSGCFFLWAIFFPNFLINWWLVANHKVGFRADKAREREGGHFCRRFIKELSKAALAALLLTLLVFNNILMLTMYPDMLFDADWNHPNHMTMKRLDDTLREYVKAQQEFWQRNSNRFDGGLADRTGYCDNFRNLYYGRDGQGRQLALINKRFADAFAGPADGSAVMDPHPDQPQPLYGYFFLDDPYLAANKLWDEEYGLVAYPMHPGISGSALLWVGMGGRMLFLSTPKAGAFTLLTPEQSPLHPECEVKWRKLDSWNSWEMWP